MEPRKQRRISKSATVYIPIGALVIIVITILGISSFLRVMEIRVQGAYRHSASEIVAVSGITPGDNLLFMDMEAVERAIIAAMPFIRDVTAVRVPPYAVLIEVRESVPFAIVETRIDVLVLDSAGRILEITDEVPPGLIEVRGVSAVEGEEGGQIRPISGGEPNVEAMREVLLAIERQGFEDDVSFIDVTNISRITMGYQDRFTVSLGGATQLNRKLERLPSAVIWINGERGEDVRGNIDVSDPNIAATFNPTF